jgi:DMSO reductase family type II enzyme chaperone
MPQATLKSGSLPLSPVQRSSLYQRFAALFRVPDCGSEAMQAYMEAFDPAVYQQASALYESAYTSKTQDLIYEELTRFYDFFGLQRAADAELPDHLSVELDFMHYLTYLEQQCLVRNENPSDIRREQRDFLSHHLWPMCDGLYQGFHSRDEQAREQIANLFDFVAQELQQLNTSPAQLSASFLTHTALS